MTNDEQLAKAYPEQIERIRKLAKPEFLKNESTTQVTANVLASAFMWHATSEGWQFWSDLYEKNPALAPVQ